MARKTIMVSDLSGETVDEKDYARIVVNFSDRRRGRWEVDLTVAEATDLFGKVATKKAAAGRPPSAQA